MPIINSGKFLSRTPKCYLQRSWAHDPEDSKIDPLVCTPERQADREPSLVVDIGQVSWLMMGLLALTRQKQLVKSSPQARHVSSKTTFLEGTSITSVPMRPTHKVLLCPRNGTAKNNSQKLNFVVRVFTYAVGSMSSTDASMH
jgi:hypothetical protein